LSLIEDGAAKGKHHYFAAYGNDYIATKSDLFAVKFVAIAHVCSKARDTSRPYVDQVRR
jgi:hypothetical protein